MPTQFIKVNESHYFHFSFFYLPERGCCMTQQSRSFFRDKVTKQKAVAIRYSLSPFHLKSFCFDCSNGASVFASATIYAFVIDDVNTLFFVQCDRTNGAGICASTASQAFIRNYMCHLNFLHLMSGYALKDTTYFLYYTIFFLISKDFKGYFSGFFKIFAIPPPFRQKFSMREPLPLPYYLYQS